MGQSSDQIRQEIDQSRQGAAEKIDQLKEQVEGTATDMRGQVQETAEQMIDQVKGTVDETIESWYVKQPRASRDDDERRTVAYMPGFSCRPAFATDTRARTLRVALSSVGYT